MVSEQCMVRTVNLFGVWTQDPMLIPTSIGAALIGIYCGLRLWRGTSKSSAVPFFLFALMMSEAGVTHCWARYFNEFGAQVLRFVDVSLTSTIALAFGLIALVDIGRLSETNFLGWLFL